MNLIPLKIKILRKFKNGQMTNDYPDFNSLPGSVRDNMDWSCYIDQFVSWQYDKKSGFGEADAYNDDPTCQYGIFCVPQAFADAAIAAFPGRVEQIDEATLESFYENRAHESEPELNYDETVLGGLRARYGTIPVAKAKIIAFFTDTTDEGAEDRINEFEGILGRTLTSKERVKALKLCEMEPGDCKAINPNHPASGIKKNKNRLYVDFKERKGFTIG